MEVESDHCVPDKKCLVCLQLIDTKNQCKSLMSTYDANSEEDSLILYDLLNFILAPETLNAGPELICLDCEQQLVIAFTFKKQCLKSYQLWTSVDGAENLLPTKHCDKVKEESAIDDTELNQNFSCFDVPAQDTAATKRFIKCHRCDENFPNMNAYRRHHYQTHSNGQLCPQCGKLVNGHSMAKHLLRHTSAKNFLCTECGKSFKLNEQLQKHLRIHKGDRRYTCDYCEQTFIHWTSKRSHMRTVHTLEKSFQCTICNKEFAESGNMYRHMRQHAGNLQHQCEHCEKKFLTSTELRVHLTVHTKEKNEICEICSKAFGSKKSLNVHKVTHSGERNYPCTVCGKFFKYAHVLRTHLKSHPECEKPPFRAVMKKKVEQN